MADGMDIKLLRWQVENLSPPSLAPVFTSQIFYQLYADSMTTVWCNQMGTDGHGQL